MAQKKFKKNNKFKKFKHHNKDNKNLRNTKNNHKINTKHNKKHRSSKLSISRLFYKIKKFIRKNPVFCSVSSMIFAIILVRLAFLDKLFGRSLIELRLWIIFFAIIFFMIGLISIKVWMRNHVSDFNMNFTHKRR